MKIDISLLNFFIWISKFIFQIKKKLFEFETPYLKSNIFLIFKNRYFNLEIDISILKYIFEFEIIYNNSRN
jgi:hypothetical protein